MPGFTGIIGAIQAHTLLGLYSRIENVAVGRRQRQSKTPQAVVFIRSRQTVVYFLPVFAAIGRFIQGAALPARVERPGGSAKLPESGIQHIGVALIQNQLRAAGIGRTGQHALPGLAAIGGFVYPAFVAITPQGAHHSYIYLIRILRINLNTADALTILEAHALPTGATIGSFVEAITYRGAVARPYLSGAHPYYLVGVYRVNGYHPDRLGILVENRGKRRAAIHRPPHTTTGSAHIKDAVVGRVSLQIGNTATRQSRAYLPGPHRAKELFAR